MNTKEIRTIKEAIKRFMPGLRIEEVSDVPRSIRIVVPYQKASWMYNKMYFYIGRSKDGRRFRLLVPVESVGLIAVKDTLATLQPLLKDYGLLLTQDAVIVEDNIKVPLDERIGNMVRALIAIEGIRRLWTLEHKNRRENGTESKDSESISISPDDRPSR